MGWLDLLELGVDIATYSKLEDMRRQGTAMNVIQAIIVAARDQVFHFKQSADNLLSIATRPPKMVAAAMKILETQLNESGITPDLFLELTDKEYTANTIRLIRESSNRLFFQLSQDEQTEINLVVSAAVRLPDYNFYLTNYSNGQELKRATQTVAEYAGHNSCFVQLGVLLYVFPGMAIPPLLLQSMFGGGHPNSAGGLFGGCLGMVLWIIGLVMIFRWMKTKDYRNAQKTVNELKEKINVEYFSKLDREFSGEERAKSLQRKARDLVDNFFKDSQSLSSVSESKQEPSIQPRNQAQGRSAIQSVSERKQETRIQPLVQQTGTTKDGKTAKKIPTKDPHDIRCSNCKLEQWSGYQECQKCGARFI